MMSVNRSGSESSSGFHSFDCVEPPEVTQQQQARTLPHLERQDTMDSDTINDYNTPPSTPATEKLAEKPKKEKKRFHLFRRSKHKHKKKHSHSSPSIYLQTLKVPDSDTLSIDSNVSGVSGVSGMSGGSGMSGMSGGSDDPDSDTEAREQGYSHLLTTEPRMDTQSVESQPEVTMATQQYLVHVSLQSGHDLAIRDRTGSSDPYVKFKCGQFKYRSHVIYRNLNPRWNESFQFRVPHAKVPLKVKVYDYDFGSLDDYMGGAFINLGNYIGKETQVDVKLEDSGAKEESLGFLRLSISVSHVEEEEVDSLSAMSAKDLRKLRSQRSTQLWRSILTVTLLEGSSLPSMDNDGLSDPYCKFKLGSQKYKSKVISKTLHPQWKERFEMRIYDGESTNLHIEVWDHDYGRSDDFIGECMVDLSSLRTEVTHEKTLLLTSLKRPGSPSFEDGEDATLRLLLTISGTAILEEMQETTRTIDMDEMRRQYSLVKTTNVHALKDIGFLKVNIQQATNLAGLDFRGTSDPFAIIEVGNLRVRTQTLYKSVNPVWDKTFHFYIKDIHDDLEVSIFNEKQSGKAEFLGQLKIPLLRLKSGKRQWYSLKDKHCLQRERGEVCLECELVYNCVRACVRTIKPREVKVLEEEQKFQRKVLMYNIKRVAKTGETIMATYEFIKSLWEWNNKTRSALAFLIFILACVFGELWMLFAVVAMIFLYQYLVVYIRGRHEWQVRVRKRGFEGPTEELPDSSEFSDLEEDLEDDSKPKGNYLREKWRQLQEVLVIVQNVVGYVADLEERIRNLFDWSVPFLCWLAIAVMLIAAVLFYWIPLRYIILAWGINKFTKKLRNPNYIDNNELEDFISRSPTDRQLLEWRELIVHGRHSQLQSKKHKKSKTH